MHKILQARLQEYVNWKFQDIQAGFWWGIGTRHQISSNHWITENAMELKKKMHLITDYPKAFVCVNHNKLEKVLKMMAISGYLSCFLRNLYEVKKQQFEQDKEQ